MLKHRYQEGYLKEGNKMKKALMIVAVVAMVIIISFTTGCFIQKKIEFNKTKEEIIKFDTEYKKIKDNFNRDNELFGEKYQNVKMTPGNEDKIKGDFQSFITSFINELKKLDVPEPLDDFYDKNIEYYSKLSDSVNIGSKVDMNELTELDIEINRIQREVYREYGLDDLINK